MSKHNKKLGAYGEKIALAFLQKRGYTIIEKNYHSSYGEIDIIALHPEDPHIIVCAEVKTRLTKNFGMPEQAITAQKIQKLHNTACSYFYKN